MFKISDILKKYRGDKDKTVASSVKKDLNQAQGSGEAGINLSCAVGREIHLPSSLNVAQVFEAALALVQELYQLDYKFTSDFSTGINTVIEGLVDLASERNSDLSKLCFSDYPKIEDYIFYHAVNVCIISLEIGLGLGYERARLIELGTAALIHDIGIIKYRELINKPETLTVSEFNKIKQHPREGFEILSKIEKQSLPSVILDAVLKEHERLDGSGYPQGLKAGQIPEYAQVIGLADRYEAMTHERPYRKKYTPLKAINEIIALKNAITAKMVKILIERFGIFPISTLVRLNTKEIAVVTETNLGSPLRPVVNVIYDVSGQALKEAKQVDLSRNPMLYIEDCLETGP